MESLPDMQQKSFQFKPTSKIYYIYIFVKSSKKCIIFLLNHIIPLLCSTLYLLNPKKHTGWI